MNDRFLRACRRQPVDATPVWFMRQAGRYMSEYRALRLRYSLLDICRSPELAVAVTLQPVDAIDVDAAILFSDLLIPFTPMGLDFDFIKGEGPAIAQPIRCAADVERLRRFEPREALSFVKQSGFFAASSRVGCRLSASAARRLRSPRTRLKAALRPHMPAPKPSCTHSPGHGIASANDSRR